MKKLLSTTAFILALTVAGAASAHMEWDSHPDGPVFDKAVAKLPPKEAAQMRDTMHEAREENASLHSKEQQIRHELHAILVAPQFDENAYVAKSKELEQLHSDMEVNKSEAFASIANDLSQPDRARLANAMMHNPPHPPHKHKGDMSENENSQYPSPPKAPVK